MDAAGSLKGASKYDCLLFDMDDTLYPITTGLNLICRKNIQDFMLQHLKIEESEVPKLCLDLYNDYGTTMAGLKAIGYEFSNDDFHAFVHGRLPYDETLKPDPGLRKLLLTIPLRKIIFTNADRNHASQVLKRLDLENCFEGIICFETLNPPPLQPDDSNLDEQNKAAVLTENESESEPEDRNNRSSVPQTKIHCKPSVEAMEAAMRIANIDPEKTVFFDDSVRNIVSGKNAGLHTVLVGSPVLVEGADFALESIHNIKEALPEIWEGAEEDHLEKVLQTNAVETVIYV